MTGENETYGVHRLNEADLGNQSYNGTTFEEFETRFSEVFLEQMGGSYELSGIMLLAFMGYGLYKTDASMDVSFSIMIPAISLLATGGFLPYGEGLLFGMLIALTGIGIFGIFKYAAR